MSSHQQRLPTPGPRKPPSPALCLWISHAGDFTSTESRTTRPSSPASASPAFSVPPVCAVSLRPFLLQDNSLPRGHATLAALVCELTHLSVPAPPQGRGSPCPEAAPLGPLLRFCGSARLKWLHRRAGGLPPLTAAGTRHRAARSLCPPWRGWRRDPTEGCVPHAALYLPPLFITGNRYIVTLPRHPSSPPPPICPPPVPELGCVFIIKL